MALDTAAAAAAVGEVASVVFRATEVLLPLGEAAVSSVTLRRSIFGVKPVARFSSSSLVVVE